MRLRSILASSCLFLVPAIANAAEPGTKAPAAVAAPTSTSQSANAFNAAAYGALRGEAGNLFFSAPSLRQALGIAAFGAKGDTAKQMQSVLRVDADANAMADDAKRETTDFDAAKGNATLAIANRLWADKTFTMSPTFTGYASKAYGAPLANVDFLRQPDQARQTINGWVAGKTNDKIKDLLPPGSIQSSTPLVITNAIYFKGNWASAFQKSATRDQAFFVDGKAAAQVPTMHQLASFKIAQKDGAKMLEMPYEKSDLAMDILLPDAKDGLPALEDKIVSGKLGTWTSALSHAKVDVSMPKVTFSWGGSVKRQLQGMGMTDAFDRDRADFTGISSRQESPKLWIDNVIHKAFVAIDEVGSEAAASTAVIFARETASVEPPPVAFTADHPFVFVIRDTKHDRILFMGRVTNPKA